jgi:hypothetical protein
MDAIINVVESALQSVLSDLLAPFPVYVSDFSEVKDEMPYVMIHGDNYTEEIAPGCGLFKVSVQIMLRSHVKEDAPEDREAAVSQINQFMHEKNRADPTSPRLQAADSLSSVASVPNLYVFGFVPTTGQMRINSDYKAYEYIVGCDLYCKPSESA